MYALVRILAYNSSIVLTAYLLDFSGQNKVLLSNKPNQTEVKQCFIILAFAMKAQHPVRDGLLLMRLIN